MGVGVEEPGQRYAVRAVDDLVGGDARGDAAQVFDALSLDENVGVAQDGPFGVQRDHADVFDPNRRHKVEYS